MAKLFNQILTSIDDFVWGVPLIVLILAVGVFLTIRVKGLQIRLLPRAIKELFVNELQNMILSGKLEIGSKLPPERELAESMKVSRAVINSGIAELEKKGFLVVRPRIGTFVADYHRDGSLDTLVAIMNYNGGVLKNREVKSVLECLWWKPPSLRLTVHQIKNC